uniref:Induced myeloid leukemia cell differentiation protein Mcl-1 n=1 Tax=Pan troglodytes TaxID=9598 RepID=G2HFR3_PANTR|nr:induced myeloid leukemia cell differentiation protein Mcl-1 [Pan troglodytes]
MDICRLSAAMREFYIVHLDIYPPPECTIHMLLDIKNEDDVKSLSRVMIHVFSDGVTNWGRIVTLISFGAFVAKHLKTINQESCIEPLAESITDVLVRTKRDWLVKQRGWDGFVEFFHVEDLEGGIRNVLLAFAGVAGVGAGLAYLIR